METSPRKLALPATFAAVIVSWIPTQALAYEPPPLEVADSGTSAAVSWQGSGTLFESTALAAGWADSGAAASPYVVDTNAGPQRFFRLLYETFNYVTVDTNQTTYYDDTGTAITPPPSEGAAWFGQDAEYRDTPPDYTDNGDGTVTDNNTGLIWQQVPPAAFYSWTDAQAYADSLDLAGESDWRLPTIKELLSLADFTGSSRSEIDLPYIDDSFFTIYEPEVIDPAKREIDGQYWSSTAYVGRTINNDSTTFGFNFTDGRIKGYPNGVLSGPTGTAFVRCVRGNPDYGVNNFVDNSDGTITDLATGLMWLKDDSGAYPAAGSRGDGTLSWQEALAWAEDFTHAGYDDWMLPDAKQLHTIVDYTRAPDAEDPASRSAAIDPIFNISEVESWFWTSTSLGDDRFEWGIYTCFGRALAIDQTTFDPTVNAHGAGAMRSDPKAGNPANYATGHGPQFDQVRVYNYARPVRRALPPPAPSPPVELGNVATRIIGAAFAPADLAVPPLSVTFNGMAVNLATVTRPSQQEISFDFDSYGLAPGDYTIEATFAAPYGVQSGTFAIQPSILLLIVDDWGCDASPLHNTAPGAIHANIPHMTTLASEGLLFTRAYSQPTCSPMRATMLTGRQPWQHGVGNPTQASNFSEAEITLPEIFTTTGAPHDMLSVGKWHLGGDDTAYSTRGGWPEFYGINGGGVPDPDGYSNWVKNSNGTTATTTVYSTTDQVNEAKTFIDARVAAGTPWFAWVAFNAPHSPFHDPPASLAPAGGYSTIEDGESTVSHQYRKMLEALDTEIGRLLESVDPAQTNILLIGDNGTPAQVVQAPYGAGHAKGDLYNGGIHVPMIAKGPAVTVTPGSSTDALVHCIDVFSTILDLAGIDEAAVPGLGARGVASTSVLPILRGTDTADRCVVAERGGADPGRAIILGDYPDYKLIINGDPDDDFDIPSFEFYNIGAPANDVNEKSPLDPGSLTGTALDAYNACLAKDLALGGGYSDVPIGGFDTVYIQVSDDDGPRAVPGLTRPNNSDAPIDVVSVTINGDANLPVTVLGRYDWGTDLVEESDDTLDQYWVKVRLTPANGGPYTSAEVVFPDTPSGVSRVFDSSILLVNAHP